MTVHDTLHTCDICGLRINPRSGWREGNNAWPYQGRACDACNMDVVVPARGTMMIIANTRRAAVAETRKNPIRLDDEIKPVQKQPRRRRSNSKLPRVGSHASLVLSLLNKAAMTHQELSEKSDLTARQAYNACTRLKRDGLVTRSGERWIRVER